jgi:hypothetical protein
MFNNPFVARLWDEYKRMRRYPINYPPNLARVSAYMWACYSSNMLGVLLNLRNGYWRNR